ncbi:MAG: obgE, partial [Chlamydiia bacterium]|nr:obgE [Chlamydiia bacterium]
ERSKGLIYVLVAAAIVGSNPFDYFRVLRKELVVYDPALLSRPFLILLNKCDVVEASLHVEAFHGAFPEYKDRIYVISAERGDGSDAFKDALQKALA